MLKGFKKIGRTDSHTIFQHQDGHLLHVSDKKIDKSQKNEMKRIPMKKAKGYYEGGDVEPDESVAGQMQQAQVQQPFQMTPMQPQAQQAPQGPVDISNEGVPVPPREQPRPVDQFANLPGYKERSQAIRAEQALGDDLGQVQAQVLNKGARDMERLYHHTEQRVQQTGKMLDAMVQDAKAQHINPNHYLDNMSSGKKVTTAISLLLGGMAGGENPAMKFLNDQIERDLKAQQANAHNKQNLLSALQHQLGSEVAAANMFRLFRADMMTNEMGKLAATAKSPQAKINALNATSELMQKYAPLKKQADMMLALKDMKKNGGIEDPSQFIPHVIPKERQKAAYEEVELVHGYKNAVGTIRKIFDGLSDVGMGAKIPLTEKNKRLQAANAQITSAIRQSMKGQGALSDQEMKMSVEPLLVGALDSDARRAVAMEGLENILRNKVAGNTPVLRAYNMDMDLGAQNQGRIVYDQNGVPYRQQGNNMVRVK